MKLDRVTGKVECGLGDNLNSSSTRQAASIQNSVANLAETKMTFYDSTEISKWQSDIIRGAHGGAVILMSPSDYPANHPQRGESRQPFQMVWMDGDSIQTSSHFLVANSDGIGFIDGDFYTSPFKTAWTIDGKFNADFIRTGTILADIFETSFNKLGDTLKLVSGALQVENDGQKIMELTKEEWSFWSGSKSIGTIGTAGEPFPDLQDQDGPVSMDGKALIVRTDKDGQYIAFSAKTGTGIILGNGKGMYLIDPNIRIVGDITLSGDMDIRGELRINGQKVIPGQNGGPDTGDGFITGNTYDPVNIGSNITGNANIVAWIDKYTKQYNIEDYIGLVYALIMVENPSTNGNDDIMQSSESAGLPPNTLHGEDSVNQGCKHLANQIRNGKSQKVDIWGVMQGYNFGDGYIPWLASRRGVNSTDLAEEYSRTVVAPSLGNTTGATYPYVNAVSQADGRTYLYVNGGNFHYAALIRQYVSVTQKTGARGLAHLETLLGQRVGNGQCYGLSAEYSGFLGGCGLGAGTKYGMTHVVPGGNTSAASDIGIAYDWSAVGWTVIKNPTYDQLVVGAIINIARGALWANWPTVDDTYGHTGVIRGLENGRIQTYEQNTELGMIVGKFDRAYTSAIGISSIVIPPE